jgi:hypothetical protein
VKPRPACDRWRPVDALEEERADPARRTQPGFLPDYRLQLFELPNSHQRRPATRTRRAVTATTIAPTSAQFFSALGPTVSFPLPPHLRAITSDGGGLGLRPALLLGRVEPVPLGGGEAPEFEL